MVKETVQSIKAENDKLKGKIQEIYAELQLLQDEVKTKRDGSHDSFRGEVANPSSQSLSESHDEFCKYSEEKMGAIESSLNTLSSSVENISTSIDQLQDYSYSYNVKLIGVPERKPRESAAETSQLCLQIFSTMGAEVQLHDIDIAHRISHRNASDGRPKPIACKFTRRLARERVMALRREINKINPSRVGLPENSLGHAGLYDHLSPRLQNLLSDAKKLKERFHFSFCWAKNSTIWLRKNEDSRPIAIRNASDLYNLTARLESPDDDSVG